MEQNALITGTAKRIGKAIARHLAAKGWNLVLHYNSSAEEAEELAREINGKFPMQNATTIRADLSVDSDLFSLIENAGKELGKLSLLVNNASVFEKASIRETGPELFDRQWTTNMRAPFFLTRDFASYGNDGNIINLVDTRIRFNRSDYAAYTLAKKGLWEITKMAALEFSPGIRVNAIAPGVTIAPEEESDQYLEKLARNTPMKRPSGIEPILKSIDYILNNEHCTGQLLYADGGENLGK